MLNMVQKKISHWLFCTKFNSQQLLFEQFFDIISNFGSIQVESEYIKILKKLCANFGKMLKSARNFFKISRKFQRDSV